MQKNRTFFKKLYTKTSSTHTYFIVMSRYHYRHLHDKIQTICQNLYYLSPGGLRKYLSRHPFIFPVKHKRKAGNRHGPAILVKLEF